MRGVRTAQRVGLAQGGCLLLTASACDADLDCDGDQVFPSVADAKVTGYFRKELRLVHALRLPMAGGRTLGLHEAWLQKRWRYRCAKRRYVSCGVQFVAVRDGGQALARTHFLVLGEDGLARVNNQRYGPLKDTVLKARDRLYLNRRCLAQPLHGPGRLQGVGSVDLVGVP